MKYVFWMLEVISLFGSCAIVERCRHEFKKNFPCFLGIISNWSCMCALFLRWQVVASIFLKISYMHNKPLTNFIKKKKKFKAFTMFFHVLSTRTRLCFIARSSCCCNCLLAITILLIFLELYTVVHILRIQQHHLPHNRRNYLFRHTKSVVCFHLTRAESQAAMMVGVPQDFDIGLSNLERLMLWLT
jgi:hypothetical protein